MHPALLQLAMLAPLAIAASAPTGKQVLTPKMDKWINGIISEWKTPGFVVAVVHLDKDNKWRVETKGYGQATKEGDPFTEDSLFEMASNSKLFTAISAGLLISDPSISPPVQWTSKMKDLLPSWKLQDPVASDHDGSIESAETAEDVVARLHALKPSTEFRQVSQYNNLAYSVLSALPKQLLNRTFTSYVADEIFKPLGMKSTTYSLKDAIASGKMSRGYTRVNINPANTLGSGEFRVAYDGLALPDGSSPAVAAGPGGVISSGRDLATWLHTLLLDGVHPVTNEVVIPASVIAQVSKPHCVIIPIADFPEESSLLYGGGQVISHYRGHLSLRHGGNLKGYTSQVSRFPNEKFGVAVLNNEDTFGTALSEIVRLRIVDELLGLEPIDWNARFKSIINATAPASPPPAPSPPAAPAAPVVPIPDLAGRYYNAGYGPLDLCYFSPNVTPTANCTALGKKLATVDAPAILGGGKTILAASLTKWLSGNFVVLNHHDGNYFNATYFRTLGNDSLPYYPSTGVVEFTRTGLGLVGVWGAQIGVLSPMGDTAETRAEVWYSKV